MLYFTLVRKHVLNKPLIYIYIYVCVCVCVCVCVSLKLMNEKGGEEVI